MNAIPARRGRKARFQTPQEAEAWALTIAPPRGSGIALTDATRGPVRFWLTANRLPSAFARGLTMADLGTAWHDTTGAALDALRTRAAAWLDTVDGRTAAPDDDADDMAPDTTTTTQEAPPMPLDSTPTAQPTNAAQNLAAALAAMMAPQAAPIDAEAVRKIVRETAADAMGKAAADTIQAAQDSIGALLDEARAIVNGAPRVVQIAVNDKPLGTLPALRHKQAEHLTRILAAGCHAYVCGPAGAGKTHAAQNAADALGLTFYMTGAVAGPHELLGYRDAMGEYRGTPFRTAYETGGVFLFDEIDGSDPASLLVINSALANDKQAFPDGVVTRHAGFICIACANTYGRGANAEYIGRSALDVATLDRFAFVSWDYDENLERAIAGDTPWTRRVQSLRASAGRERARLVISPRSSIAGNRLIAAGLTMPQCEDAVIWRGVADDVKARVLGGAR